MGEYLKYANREIFDLNPSFFVIALSIVFGVTVIKYGYLKCTFHVFFYINFVKGWSTQKSKGVI